MLPTFVSALMMAAHLFRFGWQWPALALLFVPLALLLRKKWVAWIFQALLFVAAVEWMHTLFVLMQQRQMMHQPWQRMALILGGVALFNLGAATLFQTRRVQEYFAANKDLFRT